MPSKQQREYFSPSLEILETDDALDRKIDKENIKTSSNLLESVFQISI